MDVLEKVAEARMRLEKYGEVSQSLVSTEISASWNRCLEAGLDPRRSPDFTELDLPALRHVRAQHDQVARLARTEMETLHGQIAGSNFLIAFAGPDGTVLDAIGDGSFRDQARDRALGPGMCWSEMRRGTNALGLATALQRPAFVHGAEHFFRGDSALTCVAIPVWAPDGRLAGVLDASTLCSTRQLHTRALLSMAATQIENGLFRDEFRDRLLIAFHGREEFLHTSGAGLLALSSDGHILGGSPQALAMLHDLPLTAGCSFGSIFAERFGVAIAGRTAGESFRLRDRSGSGFVAMVASMPAVRHRASPVPKAPIVLASSARLSFVAQDPAVARAVSLASAAARRRLPILIGGETGTGKEELARAAHLASGRSGRFVPVNCAALPGDLVEAELFGYAEGAFTGARRGGAAGLAVEASGGTLFLDEIGDMDGRAQAALLRLLDDWVVRPVGGGRGQTVDVLLIAATNVSLDEAVAEKRFRRDLLHRLAVVPVQLPRLADRQDFPMIARHVLAKIDPALTLTDDAVALLAAQDWPGNIRELRNLLLRASLEGGSRLGIAQLIPFLPSLTVATPVAPSRDLNLQVAQRIVSACDRLGGSISETARQLGVSRNRVYRALRRIEPREASCPR